MIYLISLNMFLSLILIVYALSVRKQIREAYNKGFEDGAKCILDFELMEEETKKG